MKLNRAGQIAIAMVAAVALGLVTWAMFSSWEDAQGYSRYAQSPVIEATVTASAIESAHPARWRVGLTWQEGGTARTGAVVMLGNPLKMANATFAGELQLASHAPPRWTARAAWLDKPARRNAIVLLDAPNAETARAPPAHPGDRLKVVMSTDAARELLPAAKRPELPFGREVVGPRADFLLRPLIVVAIVLLVIMSGVRGPARPQPEFDAIGREELDRRNTQLEQAGYGAIILALGLGGLIVALTNGIGWILVFLGVGMIMPLALPAMATLPRGKTRWREYLYYVELKHGRATPVSRTVTRLWIALAAGIAVHGIFRLLG